MATFRPGEPVPDADFVRLVVPASCGEDQAAAAEQLARARTPHVKVVREPADRVVPEWVRSLPDGGDPARAEAQPTLRQVVERRLAGSEGLADRTAVAAAVDEAMTASGL